MKIVFSFIILIIASAVQSESIKPISSPSAIELQKFLTLLTAEEQKYIQELDFITVCNTQQAHDENASLNIVKLLAKNTKITFKGTKELSWKEGMQGLKEGTCDILPWATETILRKKTMSFTRPYARIKRVIITQNHQPYIADLSLVKKQTFAMIKNNSLVQQFHAEYPEMKFLMVDTYQDALESVEQGKSFAMIISLYSAANLFDSKLQGKLKISGILPKIYDDVHSLATLKENILLHNILQKAVSTVNPVHVKKFMNQGTVYLIKPEVDYKNILWGVFIVGILMMLLIIWNRNLRKLNLQLKKSKQDLEIKTRELEILSVTDPLTNTFNRVKIDHVFLQEINRIKRYKQPLSIFMIDIDYFKNVNDEFGHLTGDKVLIDISSILKSNLRTNDFLGRWGGEEFLAICPSTSLKDAEKIAEKLRCTIENTDFYPVKKITASFGVTQWEDDDTKETLIAKADYAMYLSKHKGRNKVSSTMNTPIN